MSHTCSRWEAKYRKLEEEGARQERSIASLQEGLRFAKDDISQAIRLLQRHQSRNETPLGTGSGAVPLCR
jgi:hypothetical protein